MKITLTLDTGEYPPCAEVYEHLAKQVRVEGLYLDRIEEEDGLTFDVEYQLRGGVQIREAA